jgi:hypothetical protein
VLYLRSNLPNGCFLGMPYYAKIEVIGFDPVARSGSLQILINNNCGFRGLEPGLPAKCSTASCFARTRRASAAP